MAFRDSVVLPVNKASYFNVSFDQQPGEPVVDTHDCFEKSVTDEKRSHEWITTFLFAR